MDTVYKAGALLYTQITSLVRLAVLLPQLLLSNAIQQQPPPAHPGAMFYEGKVTHIRRRPVHNSFEYPVRMALVDLQQQPAWFQQHQAADHMTAQQAQEFAATHGERAAARQGANRLAGK
eukprot:GHRQ01038398.1.p3 GENE.GHRQ01038398.1~~GHRQ01038398.1.p3  ORF type:complete len:120 (+),score=41.73 GHRQ01038398.1:319-678(+)